MIEEIDDFAKHFGVRISLSQDMTVRRHGRYFLLSQQQKKLGLKDFFYAGMYLGKTKGGRFFPSFNLLRIINEKEANKIIVNKKAEWLFICGRDIFNRGVLEVIRSKIKGDYTLVLNKRHECLGFGKIVGDLGKKQSKVFVKNILDLGDFLRREQ